MLVKELRDIVSKYHSAEKDKIIVELYKRISKKTKEEYAIDEFIVNIKENNRTTKKQDIITFDELVNEVNYFIECVDNDLYATPNKIIPKSERSKWRFKVKRYYKELSNIDPNTHKGEIATDLLIELYKELSIGIRILKFTSWDTFRAIQVSQCDFLENVVNRKLCKETTKENLTTCINLLSLELDSETWRTSLLLVFCSCLKDNNSRLSSIEILKQKVVEEQNKLVKVSNDWHKSYQIEEVINTYIECILFLYIYLSDIDGGIKYYQKNYKETNVEVKEYILLEKLEMFDLEEEWIKEYESNTIDYRNSLKEKYKKLKKKYNK